MSEQVTRKRTCDICKLEIPQRARYIAAGVYGVDAHTGCFEVLKPYEILRFLSLDEVEYNIDSDDDNKDHRQRAYGTMPNLTELTRRLNRRNEG